MYKIGACAGKFRIIHHGHLEYFLQASLLCEVVHVFLVNDDSVKRYVSLEDTKDSIKSIFKELNTDVIIHDSTFKEGYEWDNYLIDTIGTNEFVIFNSKEDYKNSLIKNRYLNTLCDDTLGASNIELNIYEYENFNLVEKNFRRYLTKNIYIDYECFDLLKDKLLLTYNNDRFNFINDSSMVHEFSISLDSNSSLFDNYNIVINDVNKYFNISR